MDTIANNTWAFIIIFLVAFILGWLLHKLMSTCCDDDSEEYMSYEENDSDVNMGVSGAGLASLAAASGYTLDDLKIVEGIGPKIEELMHNAGIKTWEELSQTETETLANILAEAGDRFKFHDPSTWAEQAGLAANGKFDELKEYQDYLDGGKDLA